MEIKKIFVVGSGSMGGGIAQVCAHAGYSVTVMDVKEEMIEKALKTLTWSVSKLAEKGRIEGTAEEIIERLSTTTDLAKAGDADFVFEAVFEDPDTKRGIFSQIDEICPPRTIVASNTSAIPITELAEATKRPDKVVGTHFFNPVPMMRVVEVIKGLATSLETMGITIALCKSLGKEIVKVNRDVAGFALNRFNVASSIEAIRLVEGGVVSIEDMDKGVRLGFGRPMGLFKTADMVGLDIGLNTMMAPYRETGDPRFMPPMLIQRKAKAGHLGRKTGIGWYQYDENGERIGMAE
jgi:3-hydroxybutyryl-CoA dehydrogenase